jgi:hypothetical protein
VVVGDVTRDLELLWPDLINHRTCRLGPPLQLHARARWRRRGWDALPTTAQAVLRVVFGTLFCSSPVPYQPELQSVHLFPLETRPAC